MHQVILYILLNLFELFPISLYIPNTHLSIYQQLDKPKLSIQNNKKINIIIYTSVAISDNLFEESSYKSCNSLCCCSKLLYFSSSSLFCITNWLNFFSTCCLYCCSSSYISNIYIFLFSVFLNSEIMSFLLAMISFKSISCFYI